MSLLEITSLLFLKTAFLSLLGISCLRLVFLKLIRRKVESNFKHYKTIILVLTLACLSLLVYSLSNKIHFSKDVILFEYKIPFFLKNLFHQFRGVNRFIWPFEYLINLSIIILCITIFNKKIATCLITLSLLLQIQSTIPFLKKTKKIYSKQTKIEIEAQFKTTFWKEVLGNVSSVYFYPSYSQDTGAFRNKALRAFYVKTQLLTSLNTIPINSAYLARSRKNPSQEIHDSMITKMKKSTIYFYRERHFRWLVHFSGLEVEKFFKKKTLVDGQITNTIFIGMADHAYLEKINKKFKALEEINLNEDGTPPNKADQYDFKGKNKHATYKNHFIAQDFSVTERGLKIKSGSGLYAYLLPKKNKARSMTLTYLYPKETIQQLPLRKKWAISFIKNNNFFLKKNLLERYKNQIKRALRKNDPKKINIYIKKKLIKTIVAQPNETAQTIKIDLSEEGFKNNTVIPIHFDFDNNNTTGFFLEKLLLH